MQAPSGSNAPAGATRYRWLVVTLLFTAMVINYVDRQTVSLLKPTLQAEFGWSELDYADLVFWFQFAYALSYLAFGKIVDRFGARIGFSLAFVIWQAAHIGHAAMSSLKDAIIARVFLGIGEGGAFPGGVKAVSEWFPKSERAFAVGLFNAGTNIGAIVTPLVIPAITLTFGWQAAFIFTGAVGLLWLPVWWLVYRRPREHKKVNALELSHIEQDPVVVVEKVSWLKVIRARETWGYALGKFLIDP
ncbi:MFS transporter, partial [Asticcacaulis sp.]